jgi:prephenate dehydrogenase
VVTVDRMDSTGALTADRRPLPAVVDDLCRPGAVTQDWLRQADVVLLALPESALTAAIPAVANHMKPGALLMHTASVQTAPLPSLLSAATARRLQACGLNPMFAPSLGLSGRPIAVTECVPGDRVEWFVDVLRTAGAQVALVSPEQHDLLTAGIQVAAHASLLAYGKALVDAGVDLESYLRLATPPHLMLLGLLARICSGEPEVYREIQHAHPHAGLTRDALAQALNELGAAAGEQAEFAALHGRLSDWLGADQKRLAADCARWFSDL